MSSTRKICDQINKKVMDSASYIASATASGISYLGSIASPLQLRQGEAKKLIIPMAVGFASATLFSLPSMTYAVFASSLFPAYAFRGLCVGSVFGSAAIASSRYKNLNKKVNVEQKIEKDPPSHVALVKFKGEIENNRSLDNFKSALDKAFKDSEAKGVVIQIDSPGGSPVQSSNIYKKILALKEKYRKKVVVIGEDSLTSGAYYIATSADLIYVNPNTITGSIGVVSTSVGYSGLADKIGLESRTYTSGINKHRFDSMKPVKEEDAKKMNEILTQVHEDFISAVKNTRKTRLKEDSGENIFSGDFWTGKKALELGLIDKLGSLSDVLENEFKCSRFEEYGSSSFKLMDLLGDSGLELTSAISNPQYQPKLKM